jgi:hypothetical protein
LTEKSKDNLHNVWYRLS